MVNPDPSSKSRRSSCAATAVIMSEQGCKRLHHPCCCWCWCRGPAWHYTAAAAAPCPGGHWSAQVLQLSRRGIESNHARYSRTGSSLVVTSSLSSPYFFKVDTHLLLVVAPSHIPHTTPTNQLHKTEERKKVLNCLLPRWGADQAAGVPGVVAEVGPLPHPASSVEHQ